MNSVLGYSVAVSIGGAIGATLRYWVSLWLAPWSLHWPWSTFCVNALGSLLLGSGLAYFSQSGLETSWLKFLLLTGCLGSFTTFSTFSVESVQLFKSGQMFAGCAYIAMSVLVCFVAAALGGYLVHRALLN